METGAYHLLAAVAGSRRVTIGLDPPEELRRLSDERKLTCPGCGGVVVLHAGTLRTHHFAHLPGAVCRLPVPEPETEEHRAGKLLLAQWLRAKLPAAEVIVEAWLPDTGQRADLLVREAERAAGSNGIAIEYQCANLSAREWRRRHDLYRGALIQDLWLLGGSRLHCEEAATDSTVGATLLRTGELERAMLWDGAPLLFLDAVGMNMREGTLARFRPDEEAQALKPSGRVSKRRLLDLDFPFALLNWPQSSHPRTPQGMSYRSRRSSAPAPSMDRSHRLWEWLAQRFRVTPSTLSDLFGMPIAGQEQLDCEARLWQAALYYRFIHQRVGDSWWLKQVESWSRAWLPMRQPLNVYRLHQALSTYQGMLAAAGFLSLPMGYGRSNARITADLTTLSQPPQQAEVIRLAGYRKRID